MAWKSLPHHRAVSRRWRGAQTVRAGLLTLAELDHLGQVRTSKSPARRARRGISRPDGAESLRGGGSPATRSWTSLVMTSPSVAPVAELCTPSPRRPPCIFVGVALFRVAAAVYFPADLLSAASPEVVLSGAAACRFAATGCGASWASGAAQVAQFVRIVLQCYRALLPAILARARITSASVM